jgi:MFS family permease
VRAYAVVPAIFAFAAAIVYAVALFTPSLVLAWPLFVIAQVMGMSWYAPILAAMQQIAPPAMRATVSSIYLFIQNIMGIAAGTFLFGFLSDRMTAAYGNEALKFSILFCLCLYFAGSLLFALAVSRIERDWAVAR